MGREHHATDSSCTLFWRYVENWLLGTAETLLLRRIKNSVKRRKKKNTATALYREKDWGDIAAGLHVITVKVLILLEHNPNPLFKQFKSRKQIVRLSFLISFYQIAFRRFFIYFLMVISFIFVCLLVFLGIVKF